jgi:hypothetical protein
MFQCVEGTTLHFEPKKETHPRLSHGVPFPFRNFCVANAKAQCWNRLQPIHEWTFHLGDDTREAVDLLVGAGLAAGCDLLLPFRGSRRARIARAAMRDDTFAPSKTGSLQQEQTTNETYNSQAYSGKKSWHLCILGSARCLQHSIVQCDVCLLPRFGPTKDITMRRACQPDSFEALGIRQLGQLCTQPLQQRCNLRSLHATKGTVQQESLYDDSTKHRLTRPS